MQLKEMGVISAKDMTIEATVTKLSYLFAREVPSDRIDWAMQQSLRCFPENGRERCPTCSASVCCA